MAAELSILHEDEDGHTVFYVMVGGGAISLCSYQVKGVTLTEHEIPLTLEQVGSLRDRLNELLVTATPPLPEPSIPSVYIEKGL